MEFERVTCLLLTMKSLMKKMMATKLAGIEVPLLHAVNPNLSNPIKIKFRGVVIRISYHIFKNQGYTPQ